MSAFLAYVVAIFSFASVPTKVLVKDIVMNDSGCVVEYYGVPTTLKKADLKSLGLPYSEGFEMSEAKKLQTAIITGHKNVRVVVVFDRHGDSINVRTTSAQAMDPRGVRVGSRLRQVQKAWPEGKLFHGLSSHDVKYARFSTGTNVELAFTTDNKDRGSEKILVKEIHVFRFKTWLPSAARGFLSCFADQD